MSDWKPIEVSVPVDETFQPIELGVSSDAPSRPNSKPRPRKKTAAPKPAQPATTEKEN